MAVAQSVSISAHSKSCTETSGAECSSAAGASRGLTQQEMPAGAEQRALQTEAIGIQLCCSKVPPGRLKVPWGQRSPLSLQGVCVLVFVGPRFMEPGASQVGRTQRHCPGAESRTFLCRDLTKGSAISFDFSCSSLVFQPTCSLG